MALATTHTRPLFPAGLRQRMDLTQTILSIPFKASFYISLASVLEIVDCSASSRRLIPRNPLVDAHHVMDQIFSAFLAVLVPSGPDAGLHRLGSHTPNVIPWRCTREFDMGASRRERVEGSKAVSAAALYAGIFVRRAFAFTASNPLLSGFSRNSLFSGLLVLQLPWSWS
ncbi:hypothetical protein B0H13DRAFT_2682167 [Mycena leptocephala]|nr:hypothetical protein B0H13DRAFT_2682167 [Mycena leptocephala]